jgi:hypothetical protein
MAHAGAAGGLISLVIGLPLLWLALGGLFIMIAFRDRGAAPRQQPAPRRLPTVSEHPLRQVHVALAASKAAARARASRRGPGDGTTDGRPPGGSAPLGPARRGRRHIRRVV